MTTHPHLIYSLRVSVQLISVGARVPRIVNEADWLDLPFGASSGRNTDAVSRHNTMSSYMDKAHR